MDEKAKKQRLVLVEAWERQLSRAGWKASTFAQKYSVPASSVSGWRHCSSRYDAVNEAVLQFLKDCHVPFSPVKSKPPGGGQSPSSVKATPQSQKKESSPSKHSEHVSSRQRRLVDSFAAAADTPETSHIAAANLNLLLMSPKLFPTSAVRALYTQLVASAEPEVKGKLDMMRREVLQVLKTKLITSESMR
eukprot:TRINITY_DN7018_c0_g2_i2.p1 TRINITY_DN7018_c0_g2~~TRINITY_DN7018_c0_g2_i2.p1  ORF type:complete len:198 (+),score=28.44 TRINITY_DN7018_c0_g2_i2:22-594(+)